MAQANGPQAKGGVSSGLTPNPCPIGFQPVTEHLASFWSWLQSLASRQSPSILTPGSGRSGGSIWGPGRVAVGEPGVLGALGSDCLPAIPKTASISR